MTEKLWLPDRDPVFRLGRAVTLVAHLMLRAEDLSSCCLAPIDRSQLITAGRFKGSGWTFCSKCKRAVAHIHG